MPTPLSRRRAESRSFSSRWGYVRSHWFVAAPIISATILAQLAEDIAAAQFELDAGTLADIAANQERFPNPAG
jgi:aryl-alcohol dehydrogenase-like predicted oxidoreductase